MSSILRNVNWPLSPLKMGPQQGEVFDGQFDVGWHCSSATKFRSTRV